jgi:hypothetical protein
MNLRVIPGLLAAGLLAALGAAPKIPAAPASTGAYQVEILVFRANGQPSGEDLGTPAEGRGFTAPAPGESTPPDVLRTLDASQMQLGSMASKLRASGEWTVLAHAAWVQTATDWPRHAGLTLEQLGINAAGLHGTVYLEHGQYLHLGFDLQLGSGPPWSLRELRKIRYNEKNYFDHPGFGVIAIVSPARSAG